jgi:uncharacterized membrane protein YoaK (UPF0700 family)
MIWSPKSKILLIAATLLVLNANWLITHRTPLLLIVAIFLAARNGWIKTPKSKVVLVVAAVVVLNANWLIAHRAPLLLIVAIFLAARNGWIKTLKSKVVLVVAVLLAVGGAQMISAAKKVEPVYPTRINTGTWAPTVYNKPVPNYNYQDDYQDDYKDDYQDEYGGFDD